MNGLGLVSQIEVFPEVTLLLALKNEKGGKEFARKMSDNVLRHGEMKEEGVFKERENCTGYLENHIHQEE